MAPMIPPMVRDVFNNPVVAPAKANMKSTILRKPSEPTGELKEWADTDGVARIIMLAFSHDRLISSVKTKPRISER